MKTIIEKKLQEIEAEYGIKILYACESGSRAWGFPSPDSDYDVRFIYARSIEDYLTIEPKKDHLSFPIKDELDVYGWDISKVLSLITKSNTTPFEWLQSPVIYRKGDVFREDVWTLCQNYFSARSNIHHYLGIAHSAMATIENEEIKIKKLFYVLRPILAALWCVKKETIAPMNIYPLMELLPKHLNVKIGSLIEAKSRAEEGFLIKIEPDIKNWIEEIFAYCTEASAEMERKTFEIKEADDFFRKIILR